jgi:c-di-GMP-binding flagellar brake protein YcgR
MDAAQSTGSSRRVAPRYPTSLPCSIDWGNGSVEATLLDLSLTGAACVVPVAPVEMRRSELNLVLSSDEQQVRVPVRVVRVEREPFGGCLIRLKFDELSIELAKPLARFVAELGAEFHERQVALATDRLGRPQPSRFQQYPPRNRQT